MKKSDLLLSLGKRLFLLLCIFIVSYAVVAVLGLILSRVLANNQIGFLRISTILQDVLLFIFPAIATACVICRKPAELLSIMSTPNLKQVILVVAILFTAVPAMELVIRWNADIHFPEVLAGFEQTARNLEDKASALVTMMLSSNTSVMGLILNILIIGVLAGFSEELLFRGCFQRLLTTGGVNPHTAIWIVAIIFSLFHFQIFGFVPRLLLGAYFGYLLLWTRSVWTPILAHVLNNSIYVVSAWTNIRNGNPADMDTTDIGNTPVMILLSIFFTAALLYLLSHPKTISKLPRD